MLKKRKTRSKLAKKTYSGKRVYLKNPYRRKLKRNPGIYIPGSVLFEKKKKVNAILRGKLRLILNATSDSSSLTYEQAVAFDSLLDEFIAKLALLFSGTEEIKWIEEIVNTYKVKPPAAGGTSEFGNF